MTRHQVSAIYVTLFLASLGLGLAVSSCLGASW